MSLAARLFRLIQKLLTAAIPRLHISENTFLIALAVIIGVLGGLGNYLFRQTIELVHLLVVEQGLAFFHIAFDQWAPQRLLLVLFPAVGGLLVLPLWIFFGKDLKSGFAGFLVKVNLQGAKLPLRPIFTRGLGAAITLGTGGSAGQEGPIAVIGGTIGSQFGKLFRMSGDRLKVLVACGAAAGVAATFNAPIAGVFFATEIVLLSSFELASFTSIVIASGMATVVSRALLGNISELTAPPYFMHSFWELVLYLLLGGLIGALATGFIELHFRIKDLIDAVRIPRLAKPVLGGLVVGAIGVGLPQVFGNGYEFMETVLHGEHAWALLALLVLAKAVATSITLGSGLPGGMFAPCLFLGAVAGGAFGHLAALAFPDVGLSPGAYALVGMGAFLSAATHAPMTAIFLLFEITDSYQVIIPIMLTCVIGTSIARHFKKDSLETVELSRAGIDLEAGKERNIMKALLVRDVMARDVETVPENMTLGQFAEFTASTRHTNFPLVNAEGEMTGIISVQDFMGVVFERELKDLVVIKELATTDVITVTEEENLDQALRKIGYRNIEQLPVVAADNPRRLVGIISRKDIISAYNRALMSRNLEDEDE
ncbi:CIC family chloride channel protein [Geothermobacter ehrlichii]|uniref:CIC family chloride channel protein n=1 Tax=Geothermobacter ehrlichii TaxID=213224 RepID=A0A5D3WFN0_9BACT|nr:chloride channel protein [Geothermobacter ehrlichii]TYO96676.1 CIC family chloride channel protein [Geothermobacter ehrlichii]